VLSQLPALPPTRHFARAATPPAPCAACHHCPDNLPVQRALKTPCQGEGSGVGKRGRVGGGARVGCGSANESRQACASMWQPRGGAARSNGRQKQAGARRAWEAHKRRYNCGIVLAQADEKGRKQGDRSTMGASGRKMGARVAMQARYAAGSVPDCRVVRTVPGGNAACAAGRCLRRCLVGRFKRVVVYARRSCRRHVDMSRRCRKGVARVPDVSWSRVRDQQNPQ